MIAPAQRVASSVGVAMVLGATGCAPTLPDADSAAAAVRANLVGQGLDVASVSCPSPGPSGSAAVVCRAVVDGVTLSMDVILDERAATLRVTPKDPVLVVSTLRPQIERAVAAQGLSAAIDCDASIWLIAAGAVHRCRVTERAGARWIYEATFEGTGLEHTARLLPETNAVPAAPSPRRGAR